MPNIWILSVIHPRPDMWTKTCFNLDMWLKLTCQISSQTFEVLLLCGKQLCQSLKVLAVVNMFSFKNIGTTEVWGIGIHCYASSKWFHIQCSVAHEYAKQYYSETRNMITFKKAHQSTEQTVVQIHSYHHCC